MEIAVVTLENNAAQKNFLCHAPPPPKYNFFPTVVFMHDSVFKRHSKLVDCAKFRLSAEVHMHGKFWQSLDLLI